VRTFGQPRSSHSRELGPEHTRTGQWLLAHPVLAVVAIGLCWHAALYLIAVQLLPPLSPEWFPDLGGFVVNVCLALLTGLVLWRLGWWRRSGAGRLGRPVDWWYAAPLVVIALSYFAQGVDGDPGAVLGRLVWLVAGVGISEELYSRGLSLEAARALSPVTRCATVAVVFGVGHLQNWLFFGNALDDTLAQIVMATTYGFVLAALRLRIGTIWPLVLVHGLDDWAQLSSPGKAPDWWMIAVHLFQLAYAAWLLRSVPVECANGGQDPHLRTRPR